MKHIFKLSLAISLLFGCFLSLSAQESMSELTGQCAASAGDVTYLKDFPVKLDAGTPGGKPLSAKFSMLLSKNTAYRFTICTAPDSEGEAILQIYELNNLIGSTYNEATGKDYPSFDFKCQKTAVYHIFISFKEGKPGEAVGIMSFIERL
ncbi:MAG: hypothetical protein JXA77_02510 [Bacteroidales bacterium]|nr:hypothetical protein [Bacteroidales bacterium]MBN2817812.1 hypothetical protein [Bacteroidales bacterium]